ncbi:DUF4238 domain-containing protein [Butyrivibrio sp. INlla16]|uniref:DUF4238 domain-containing protein n=1 Tax=Butyrivibrio sp. INlla16 TaxID=1520807 RepID=UPI00088ACFFC|nr:DUF4238 domain-containing protein [Butyrivibrio sp. INlla16]SDB49907.1 Protein of unknown function [Butyrivibrio sp. INlla16]
MNNMTVKQHYVPQFYLKHFANKDGFLQVFNIEKGKTFSARPEDICFKNNLYETKWQNENERLGKYVLHNQIEKYFASREALYAALQTKIIALCNDTSNKEALILRGEEVDLLREFYANMLLRNPYTMEKLGFDGSLDDVYENEEIQIYRYLVEQLGLGDFDSILQASYKKGVLTDDFQESYVNGVANDLKGLSFCFLHSHETGFLTTDFPVSFGMDLSIEGSNKLSAYFPIAPNLVVLFGNYTDLRRRKNKIAEIDADIVYDFNKDFLNANKGRYKFVFAHSTEILDKCIG